MTMFAITMLDLLIIGAVFALVLSVWIGGVLIWSSRKATQRRQVEARLGVIDESRGPARVIHLWQGDTEATTVVQGGTARKSFMVRFKRALHDAGIHAPVASVIGGVLGLAALIALAMFVFSNNIVLTVASVIVTFAIFRAFILQRIASRTALFERQFVDAMELSARSLRAGHPLMGAFRLVSEELSPPVSDVFLEVCQHHEMGMGLGESLQAAAEDLPTGDMRLFATSVSIQMRSGGNLADMMERLAAVVRDRMRIARRIRVLTAQTQLSKRILVGLPIVMFLFLNVIATEYMKAFYETRPGNILLAIGLAGLILGAWSMNRMAVLKY